jgi:hypothetical protein
VALAVGLADITAKARGGAARQQVIETVRDGARFKYKLMGFMVYF